MIEITTDELGSLLLGTVRYVTRTRGAYTVEYLAKLIRRHFQHVDDYDKRQIVLEMEIAREGILEPTEIEELRELVEEIRPPRAPFTVDYRCSSCKSSDLKLWRGIGGAKDSEGNELLCANCLAPGVFVNSEGRGPCKYIKGLETDQVNGWIPAVPAGDTYWGYTSVPTADIRWWKALPTYAGE